MSPYIQYDTAMSRLEDAIRARFAAERLRALVDAREDYAALVSSAEASLRAALAKFPVDRRADARRAALAYIDYCAALSRTPRDRAAIAAARATYDALRRRVVRAALFEA